MHSGTTLDISETSYNKDASRHGDAWQTHVISYHRALALLGAFHGTNACGVHFRNTAPVAKLPSRFSASPLNFHVREIYLLEGLVTGLTPQPPMSPPRRT